MRKTSLRELVIVISLFVSVAAAADTPSRRITPTDGPGASTYGPYKYDPSGNIMFIGSSAGTPGSYYVYDPMSRIVSAAVQQGTAVQTQSYGYDAYGNRIGVGGSGGGTYTVDALTNRLTSQSAQYDAAGNLTSWYPPDSTHSREYSYDAGGMLIQEFAPVGVYPTRSVMHIYTASDERYWKFETLSDGANVSHYTIRDLGGKVLRDYVQDTTGYSLANEYVYRNGLLLASIKASTTHHYSLDHLGTPRIVTDQNRYQLAEHTYYPFGAEITDGSATDGSLKFTGHERNTDVMSQVSGELDYMHARFYGPKLGRFLSVDPILDMKTAFRAPQNWNRYSYVRNNPLRFTDPTGKYICTGTKDQCKAFEAALSIIRAAANEATRTRQPGAAALNSVLSLYGKAGEKNGTTVVVKATGVPGATGSAQTSGKTTTLTVEATYLNSVVSTGKGYVDLAKTAAHEGDHAVQVRANPEFQTTTSFRDFLFLERSAWRTENFINSTLGISDSVAGGIWQTGVGWNPAILESAARANASADCSIISGGCTP